MYPRGELAAVSHELLDKLIADNLADRALALLAPALEKRKTEQQERSAARKEQEEAVSRLEGLEEQIGELTAEQVDQAEHDLDAVWARWSPEHTKLRERLAARRAELAGRNKPVD